jgi:hypothetical protein
MILLFEDLQSRHPTATAVRVVLDNPRYNHSNPTLTPVFGICFPISHLWAIRKSLALRMRGSGGFLLSTDWATEHARTAAVER